MATNITVRVPWHMDGWNGTVCSDPTANSYCSGRHSYPGDYISGAKDDNYEKEYAGKHCSELTYPPPCALSCNAFGDKPIKCKHEPPAWFKGAKGIWTDVPPSTVYIWPYEQMYGEEATANTAPGRAFNNDARRQMQQEYFSRLTTNESILVYYANYSNPFSDEEKQRYIVIGLAKLASPVGEELFFENVSDEIAKTYAGGIVWQRALTSTYPYEGMRIPYEKYYNDTDVLENIIIEPDNPRAFKYATREICDDDLITLVERLIGVAEYLEGRGDKTQNWSERKSWLIGLLDNLWKNRGAYPGFSEVLRYLGQDEYAYKYLKESCVGNSVEAYKTIKDEILNDSKIKRKISLKGKDKVTLLLDILPRFHFTSQQIASLVDGDGVQNGITATAEEINNNPYLLCEQYIGNNQDDIISFYQIDNGSLPSPEYGIDAMVDADSAERFRALCVDALKWDNTHSFTPSMRVLNLVNHRVEKMRDWRKVVFSSEFFEVDKEMLSQAITFREDADKKLYLYLNEIFEDERFIETTLKALVARSDIILKQPVTTEKFFNRLFNNNCRLSSVPEYKQAVVHQSELCADMFRKGLCVISGSAGTGKTSLIREIISTIKHTDGAGVSIRLLAPTGKAAERIREKTGQEATTIHSFIASCGWLNENMTFKRKNGSQDKNVTTVILDEASMADLSLLATLFRAIHWNNVKRLILVGDPNQLPPIGRGKVFSDIIDWLYREYPENIGKLEYNLRQMENIAKGNGIGIVNLAELLIQEKQDTGEITKYSRESMLQRIQEGGEVDKDLFVHYWKNATDLNMLIESELRIYLGNLDNSTDLSKLWIEKCTLSDSANKDPSCLQVLAPFRGDDSGTDRLNVIMQVLLNSKNKMKYTLDTITLFDKVIQYVNRPKSNPLYAYNWETSKVEKVEIFNGDMGFVYPHGYDSKKWTWMNRLERFSVKFKGKENYSVTYGKTEQGNRSFNEKPIDNLELAYAISVHKSQGSEFGTVYLILPNRRSSTLSMELLYTAVTRAQHKLVLLIQEDIATFSSLTKIERSAVRRINSSVFKFNPLPEQLSYLPSHYDEYKVISTLEDFFVRSKSEALIANALSMVGVDFSYEKPLYAPDGTMYLPDFTITFQGNDYYWEHWGLLDKTEYKAHAEKKIKWYEKHFQNRLIESVEGNDISTQIKAILLNLFNISL